MIVKVLKAVVGFAPMVIGKIVGSGKRKTVALREGNDNKVVVILLESLIESLDTDQMQKFRSTLTPQQGSTFVELLRALKKLEGKSS